MSCLVVTERLSECAWPCTGGEYCRSVFALCWCHRDPLGSSVGLTSGPQMKGCALILGLIQVLI